MFDSINVTWQPPQQPNGIIQGYIINYRTYKMSDEFRKEIQEKTYLNYLLAENLDENVTYHFMVRAETSAGLGAETLGNVTTGYNIGFFLFFIFLFILFIYGVGAPLAVEKPVVFLEHSTFLLKWDSKNIELMPIKGHLIQTKRLSTHQQVF